MKYISINTLEKIIKTINSATEKSLNEGAITKSDAKFSIDTANIILATAEKLATTNLENL